MTDRTIGGITRILAGLLLAGGASLAFPQSEALNRWEAPAQWHRFLKRATPGTLILDQDGVEFRSRSFTNRWTYADIQTFDLAETDLTLTSYENRPWYAPGNRRFHFTWTQPIPANVASLFAERVSKPVRNGVPDQSGPVLGEIPAHRRARWAGSNGRLRFTESGIAYVTDDGRDAGDWRWTDLQTIANPNPYELRLTGYREVVAFDLKKPMPRELFEHLWDQLYAATLNILPAQGGPQ